MRLELQQGDKAISLAESLISQRTEMLGANHPSTANAFEFAARAEMIRRNWVRAAAHAESANAIRHITKMPATQKYAMEQMIICANIELGDLKKARVLLEAFQDSRSDLIKQYAMIRLETYSLLIQLEEKAGRDAEALLAEEKRLQCSLENFPRSDSRVLLSVQHLRMTLIKQKKWDNLSTLEKEWKLSAIGVKE